MKDIIENGVERFIFASRWVLAPIYIGLVVGLVVVLFKFFEELWHMITHVEIGADASQTVLSVLGLLDLALLANLILIVIFAGYENFVSKINVAIGSEDRPHWMGHVDFSGLKIKLIGSLVAISVIELLQDFVAAADDKPMDYEAVLWRIILHVTFLLSGVMFAVMDYLGDKRKIMLDVHVASSHGPGSGI
jgi:uncharacterized protein (TIGR00645 family)